MPSYAILDSYTLVELRKEIEQSQLKGYSRMTKPEIINLMMSHKSLFQHLKGKAGKKLVDKGEGLSVAILKTYTLGELRKEVGKTQITGYNKASKDDVIKIMMENKERFHHLLGKGVEQPAEAVEDEEDDEVDEEYENLTQGEKEEVDAYNFIFPIAEANRRYREEHGIPEQDPNSGMIVIDQEEEREEEGYRAFPTGNDTIFNEWPSHNYNIYTKEAFNMYNQRVGDWDPKTSTIILFNGDRLVKAETEEDYRARLEKEEEEELDREHYARIEKEYEEEDEEREQKDMGEEDIRQQMDEALEKMMREKEKYLRLSLRPSVDKEVTVARMMNIYRKAALRDSVSERMESKV